MKHKKLLLALLILTIVLVSGCDEFVNYESKYEVGCKDICTSNKLNYYKFTEGGYAGTIRTCYCKNDDGGISTHQM